MRGNTGNRSETTTTEWGVRSSWGDKATESLDQAQNIVENMKKSGHHASVIMRGVTPWVFHYDD